MLTISPIISGEASMFYRKVISVLAAVLLSSATAQGEASSVPARISQNVFGRTSTGTEVPLYTLTNSKGMQVAITPWGATVVSIKVPDRSGKMGDVVLGFDSLDGYLGKNPYFGAIVGRYGNRIGKGRFTLDGKEYTLARNNGENHLHGGNLGFDKRLWRVRQVESKLGPGLELKYSSPDGEEGYSGTLDAKVVYTLTDKNELRIDYLATTDKPTVVNLTNHSYFNLAGEGNILGHSVMIKAMRFTPTDSGQIPTGELRNTKGTAFDFTMPHTIGERINTDDEQLKFGKGYDHNWVLDGVAGKLRLAARVSEPQSGRVLEVLTTEPGLQFYSGNFLDGTIHGKGGRVYEQRAAFCMETQHFPDSPNKPNFPSTTLRPGQRYQTTTVYRFSTT
jgi:aldose 1-epimerase